ncbi:MAG TPA: DNA-3-methyladenine glycosylase I [Frankiaceae bacterium]|nr:DNA-3-methyladenine glycosylase I [Frankiaceae bacterium]
MSGCWAPVGDPLLSDYHDEEWGRPVGDESLLFERVSLEGFQSGLSWRTVLAKRPAFREVFAEFDPVVVAAFTDADVERLMTDARIIRNRRKIEAVIANARLLLDAPGELPRLLWSHEPADKPAPATLAEVPPTSPEAVALSKLLRRRGFAFVGPVTVYSSMQACGLIDDHVADCPCRPGVEAERTAFVRPG